MRVLVFLVSVLFMCILGFANFYVSYQYDNTIGSFWSLAEKASTIQQKSEYIDKFLNAYGEPATSHNALIFKTPDNSVENNLVALRSLQARLHEIKSMDIQSFAYQTAIQQITQQEQKEGGMILYQLKGGWLLAHHPILWGWINVSIFVVLVVICVIAALPILDL